MIYLYVSTFGKSTRWIKNGIPIEVGSALRNINSNGGGVLTDNIGENISNDNMYWGELTGLYWIWKNVSFKSNDIIGFCHYNKKLDISNNEIKRIIQREQKKWIVLKPCVMVPHSYPNDVYTIEKILKKSYPKYWDSWKKLYNHDGSSINNEENCSNCEIFYTTYNEFNHYCEFLFSVLFELRKEIGNVERTPYHKRYCAFLGERLLSVYLSTNNLSSVSYSMEINEPIIIKTIRRLIRKNSLLTNSRLCKYIKNFLAKNRKSSYQK